MPAWRVVRVRPDVPAIDRVFDYTVPDDAIVPVGTIVRIDLHGRHVRGWVVATDVDPGARQLLEIRKVSSGGPPPEVVGLCDWIAWRWAGPPALVLRAASPANAVEPMPTSASVHPGGSFSCDLLVWPPAADRREVAVSSLAAVGSTIVVVPDVARAATFAREVGATGRRVAPLGSDRSDAERTRAWATSRTGSCVVVGGRAALLAPVPDLAAVILLDEADEALKEERVPAWAAREVAAERARRAGAGLTLVTPAPTVEGAVLATHVEHPDRPRARAGWARVEIVDPRDEQPGRQLVTDRLMKTVRAELDAQRRVVCVLNRKGRARLLVCDECGGVARCERCGAAVVETEAGLACGRCGAERPTICAECHSTVLRARRLGVSRVREALERLLPAVAIDEVDATTRGASEAAVVVGTEAALHRRLRAVGMVAFLEFDQELLAPRYRAAEQAMWLLVRASRLVGGRRGRILLQTRVPDHEVVIAARDAEPMRVVDGDRGRRERLGFPPFGGLAELSGNAQAVETAAVHLAAIGLEVLGPEGGRALVRAKTPDALADALEAIDLDPARAHGRLRVEVDPLRV